MPARPHTSQVALRLLIPVALFLSAAAARAQDTIGLAALRQLDPTLTGSGVIIAQPEADYGSAYDFEVNPAYTGQPASKFIYVSGTDTIGPTFNSTYESAHADTVGDVLYGDTNTGDPEGVAPGVSQIYNYDANYFINYYIVNLVPIQARIVNQSFVATGTDISQQMQLEQFYDDYSATYNTLFISGAGDGGAVLAPASAYNGIAVSAYEGATSAGPTYDGRSKPDITAPGSATSFSTPLVSGAAAILLQAAQRGDAGPGTESDASDARTLKALLLNGAVKPPGWTHTDTAPLDPTYGAGILNIDNSYLNLAAGEQPITAATSGSASPIDSGAPLPDEGWNLAAITNPQSQGSYLAESNHYLFNLSSTTALDYTLTSTLTWWKQAGYTSINNLDLLLFNALTGATIALSDSDIDNVQELYVPDLPSGQYDLVVEKDPANMVTPSETYALAFNFSPVPEPSTSHLLILLLAITPLLHPRLHKKPS